MSVVKKTITEVTNISLLTKENWNTYRIYALSGLL